MDCPPRAFASPGSTALPSCRGSGTCPAGRSRLFCVSDVAAGLLAAYRAETLHHDLYHLGSGRNYDTAAVAAAVRSAVPGSVIEVGPGTQPWTTYNTMRGPLAGARLRDDTGFEPRLTLEDGIRDFADWMRERPETLQ